MFLSVIFIKGKICYFCMDKKELEFILEKGEGQFIEFKENFDKNLSKGMVAFANASGGRILLGIDDKRTVKGLKITNKLKSQVIDLGKNCDPQIKVNLKEFDNILIVEIPESRNKPCQCSRGFYLRIGANSQKLTRDEILQFSIKEGKINFDEQINHDFDFEKDFDENKLGYYLKISKLSRNIQVKDILLNLSVAKIIDDVLRLKNAGILFFAKNPAKYFMTSKVICVNYQTNEKVNILDRKIFDNGLLANLEDAINYVKKHINVRFKIKTERKEILQFPEEAIRESIVNAIMHRDYFEKSGDILIEVFRNKFIVSNPGGLVEWLKKEDFGKYSRTRNPMIASLLSNTEYVEKLGTGINRIKSAVRNAGLPEAKFEFDDSFSVTLFDKEKWSEKWSEKQIEILKLIIEKPKISRKKLSEKIGINQSAVQKYLEKMKKQGIIKRIGPDKGGHWEVL